MFTDELMEQKYNETNNINDVLIVLLENALDATNKDKASLLKRRLLISLSIN